MPRNITVTFSDGSTHVYNGAPDDVTPEQITERAQSEFGKEITSLDGGKGNAPDVSPLQQVFDQGGNAEAINAAAAQQGVAIPDAAQIEAAIKYRDGGGKGVKINAPSGLEQMGASVENAAAAVQQGVAGPLDAVADFGTAIERGLNYGGGRLAEGGLRLFGADETADSVRAFTDRNDSLLGNQPNMNALIERFSPTPEGMEGSRFAGQILGGMASPFNALMTVGKVSPVAQQAQRAMANEAAAAAPAAPAQQLVQEAKDVGVRLMTSDASPPRNFVSKSAQTLGERIPIAGTGGPRAAQQVERTDAVKAILQEYGATEGATESVLRDLVKTRGGELTKLTAAKTRVIQGIEGEVPVTQTMKAIDDQIANLEKIGTDATKPVIAKLQNWRAAIQGKDLPTVEAIRKEMGDAFSAPELSASRGTGEKALSAIYGPLRADMANIIKAKGGDEALKAWKGANDRLSAMAGELKAKNFKAVLSNADTTPEKIASLLFSKHPSDVRRVYGALSPHGQQRARAAILQHAMEKAGGLEQLSPDRFLGQLKTLSKSIGVAFPEADLARVQGLTRVLQATKRASEAAVATPTGQQNYLPTLLTGGVAALGGFKALIGAGGIGMLARAYESAPVRDALLKLARTPAGSKQEGLMLDRSAKALASFLNTEKGQVGAAMNDNMGVAAAARNPEEDQAQ